MKILFLNSTRYDYLQDVVYSGLIKILGTKNIKTIPFNLSYIFNKREYPKNLGYNKNTVTSYLKAQLLPFNYDCVIIGAAKKQAFECYLKIVDKIPKHIPIIFIDGGDVDWVGGDLERTNCYHLYEDAINKRPFDIVFKREMIIDKMYESNVYPCPFAFNFDRIDGCKTTNLKYDVSFWAVESHPIRTQVLTMLQDKYDCKENGSTLNQTFKNYNRKGKFYFEELQSSKIVLNFRGSGWDTLRYWEVPALKTFMISQKPQIVIPQAFEHDKNIIYCNDDLSDLIDLIDYYLINNEKRNKIAENSYNHLRNHHSDIERAKYILQAINSQYKKRECK